MQINPQAEQATSDLASLVATADNLAMSPEAFEAHRITDHQIRTGVFDQQIALETVIAPEGVLNGDFQLEARAELQVGNPEALEAIVGDAVIETVEKKYVGDAATDDTVAVPPELVVPDFMKDHPLAKAPEQELMRMAFSNMFPTITGPRADTRAAYQHGKLSQVGPIVEIGRGLKGPRQFKVQVVALPRQINKKGQATRVKLFAPNVAGLVPA
jgi:hypothetical protein